MDSEEVPAVENVEETQDTEDAPPPDTEDALPPDTEDAPPPETEEVTEENTDQQETVEENEGEEETTDEKNVEEENGGDNEEDGKEDETGGDEETGESNAQPEETEEVGEPSEGGDAEETGDAEEAKENGDDNTEAVDESNAADDGDGEKEATEEAAAAGAVDENGMDENGDGENGEAKKEEEAEEPEAANDGETNEEVEEPVNDAEENGATEEEKVENGRTNGDISHIPDFTDSEGCTLDPVSCGVPVPVSGPLSPATVKKYFPAMSTQATPEDLDALKQAIADVRSDDAGIGRKSWVLVGHLNNNPNVVGIIAQDVSPEATLESFVEKLEEDQVMYGLIRMTTTVDMSNTVKFVYVHWAGDNVPFAKKGRFGVVHGSVVEHFMPYHIQIETGNKDELAEEELVKLLEESSFTRNKVIEGDNMANRQQRGFTAHQVNRKRDGELRSVAPKGLAVEVEPELNQLIGEVRSDKAEAQWVLAGYKDGDLKKPLTAVGSGSGDIEELKESLQDDQVMYGLIRTADVVDEIHTVKFVYIYWVGENVKPMTKGKVSAYAGPVEQIFSPIHVSLNFSNRHDILQEVINDKVMAGSGSKSFVK